MWPNFIRLWEWTWCQNVSLHQHQHFNCVFCSRACIFQQTDNSMHISVMPNSKYAVMSCPSSKLDKVCIVCKATEKKKTKTKHFTGRRTSQIGSVVTSFVLFCFVLFFVSGGKNPDPKKSQLGFFAAKFLGKYFELFSKTFSQFFFFLRFWSENSWFLKI